MGGGEGKALFIDTEGSFRPERIAPIATRFGLEPSFVLDNIGSIRVKPCQPAQQARLISDVRWLVSECCRAYNPDNVEEALKGAAEMLVEQPFRLLVIDSLIAPFRVEYNGRGELAEYASVLPFKPDHALAIWLDHRRAPPASQLPLSFTSSWPNALQATAAPERPAKRADADC